MSRAIHGMKKIKNLGRHMMPYQVQVTWISETNIQMTTFSVVMFSR